MWLYLLTPLLWDGSNVLTISFSILNSVHDFDFFKFFGLKPLILGDNYWDLRPNIFVADLFSCQKLEWTHKLSFFFKTCPYCIALKCRKNLVFCLLIFKFDLIKSLSIYIQKLLIILEYCHTMLFFLFHIGVKTEVKTWNIEQLSTKNYLLVIFWRLLKFKGLGSIFYHNIFCFIGWIEKCMFFDSLWSKPIKVKIYYQVWYKVTMPVK